MNFVHLHTHSHYSIGRAAPRVRDLVERAAALGMPALALTDNNTVAGLNELHQSAQEFGIQPIIGCEIDVLPSTHVAYQGLLHSLVALVEDEQGYRNLTALLTGAHERPADSRTPSAVPPHVTTADLSRFTGGLIYLIGSPRSELFYWLRRGDPAETKNYLNRLANGVGQRNLYFEILEYPDPRVRKVMDYILELSRFLRIPAVATQNVHFLDPAHMPAYCALVQHPRLLSPHWPPPDHEMPTRHFTTPREMERRFGFTPELLEQSVKIAARCSFTFPRPRPRVPAPDLERGQDPPSVLWELAVRGAASRYGELTEAIKERLNLEYADIRGSDGDGIDMADYLLFLRDVADFLRGKGLPRGVGRGPILSSVMAYALGIIEVDPLRYKLEYHPLRPDPGRLPPFQIEVSSGGMEQVLQYLGTRYGTGNVANVGRRVDWERPRLFQHLCRWAGVPAASLRDFQPDKALSWSAPVHGPRPPAAEGNAPRSAPLERRSARLEGPSPRPPNGGPSPPTGGAKEPATTGEETRFTDPRTPSAPTGPVRRVGERSPDSRGRGAPFRLLGEDDIPRGKSLRHAKSLAEAVFTLHPCPRGFEADRAQYVVSKEPVEAAVPVITDDRGRRVCQADADFLDRLGMPRIQFTSAAMLNVLERAQRCIRQEEDRSFSLSEIPFHDEPTFRLLGLGLTNGIAPLHRITAKSLLRAEGVSSIEDLLRVHARAARRRPDLWEPDADGVREGDKPVMDGLPDCILCYWCAYLKVHHPVSYMVAMLTHSLSARTPPPNRPRFQILLREARQMGIEVLGPQINFSAYEFAQERRRIRTGLMVVQGLGERIYREIDEVRHGMPFMSVADFCRRTDPRRVTQQLVVNLIKAGVFDVFEPNRTRLLVEFERALKNARMRAFEASARTSGVRSSQPDTQLQLFDASMFEEEGARGERFGARGGRLGEPSETNAVTVPPPSVEDVMRYEQEAVGYSITHDLLDHYTELMGAIHAISPFEITSRLEGRKVYVAGYIDHVERESPPIPETGVRGGRYDEGGAAADAEASAPSAVVLDLEGHVVRVSPSLEGKLTRIQNARTPVLIEGTVRRRGRSEFILEAQDMCLLDEVTRKAEQVALMRLNLAGENRRTVGMLHSLLKAYRGSTVVEVENAEGLSRWATRKVEKSTVFFCPPLHEGLRRLLSGSRLKLYDRHGRLMTA